MATDDTESLDARSLCVLLVGPERPERRVLMAQLDESVDRVRADEGNDIGTCLQSIEAGTIDAVVIAFPGSEGRAACGTARRIRDALPDLPQLLVCPEQSTEAQVRALRAGADEVVPVSEVDAKRLARAMLCAIARRTGDALDARAEVLCFGEFELSTKPPELRLRGEQVRVHRTPLRLLVHLARNAGRVVPKAELLEEVWKGSVVADTAVSSALKELRKSLADDGARQSVIKTLRGQGYRFAAPLRVERMLAPGAEHALAHPDAIAVLPFEDLSRDPDQDYFTLGMTEALIHALTRIPSLKVISRNSAMRYRGSERSVTEIARELSVSRLLTGSIARTQGRVRVSVQLLHADGGHLIWADQYDRDLVDVLALQSEVAGAVLRSIQPEISQAEAATASRSLRIDPTAHDEFLKGRHEYRAYTRESLLRARAHFEASLRRSPAFAEAELGIAECYQALSSDLGAMPRRDGAELARQAAERAIAIDPSLGAAHAILGTILANHEWRWHDAEAAFHRAVERSPGDPRCLMGLAELRAIHGQHEEALALARRALEIDSWNLPQRLTYARLLRCARREDEALAEQQRVVQLEPELPVAHAELGTTLYHRGRYEEAVLEWGRVVRLSGLGKELESEMVEAFRRSGINGYWRRWLDLISDRADAGEVPPGWMWVAHAALGELDRAFAWLERDYEQRAVELAFMRVNPFFDPLRGDPRFHALLDRVGLAST